MLKVFVRVNEGLKPLRQWGDIANVIIAVSRLREEIIITSAV